MAKALFEEKGVGGLSMRAIAARSGIPTMTLYGYFPSKTAIVRKLWTLAFEPLFAEMLRAERSHPEAGNQLRAVCLAYVDYWLRHPDHYRMVFLIEDRRDDETSRWYIEETDVIASYMRLAALIARASGKVEAECVADAEALICALNGIAHMAITVSEYRWRGPVDYIDRILPAFLS